MDDGECVPPWLAFPEIPAGSIGWRMGAGEMEWEAFYRWYGSLTIGQAADYASRFPEPTSWYGTYALIREHPWN